MSIYKNIASYHKILNNNLETILTSGSVTSAYCTYKYTSKKHLKFEKGETICLTILSTIVSGPLTFGALYVLPYAVPAVPIIAMIRCWKKGF